MSTSGTPRRAHRTICKRSTRPLQPKNQWAGDAAYGGRNIGASAEHAAIEIDAGEGGKRDRRHGDPNGG